MHQEYELISYPKLRHIHIFIDELTYRSPHLHGDYEICFALQGNAHFLGLGQSLFLQKKEAIFFDSNEVHSIISQEGPLIGLFVQVSSNFLQDYLPELHGKRYRNANMIEALGEERLADYYQKALETAKDFFAEVEGYRVKTFAFVLSLISDLFSALPYDELTQRDKENRNRHAERLKRILDYIDAHHSERISLSEVASMESITPTHLSHLFSEGLGISFQDYLSERRLETALHLLRNSEKGVIEIALEAGFSDPKYLSRLCKERFHCPPGKLFGSGSNTLGTPLTQKGFVMERIYDKEESLAFLSSINASQ